MNLKIAYSVLIGMNVITICGSIYGIFTVSSYFFFPLLVGITFFTLSVRDYKALK